MQQWQTDEQSMCFRETKVISTRGKGVLLASEIQLRRGARRNIERLLHRLILLQEEKERPRVLHRERRFTKPSRAFSIKASTSSILQQGKNQTKMGEEVPIFNLLQWRSLPESLQGKSAKKEQDLVKAHAEEMEMSSLRPNRPKKKKEIRRWVLAEGK